MPHCPLLLPLNRSATILNLQLTLIPPPLDKSNFNSVLVSLPTPTTLSSVTLSRKHSPRSRVIHRQPHITTPHNGALERRLDSEFKRFLLKPRNLHSLCRTTFVGSDGR
ncbi:unnamed protein product [Linum trigynum]|uniref:Uncharacterized protein n=1 Tax=Linum trigynum TaxID=586398 RepID=A0AAV2DAB1_9ROSI